MKKKFMKICRMTQQGVKEYVTEELKNTHDEILVDDGFVFAKGTFPVLLVAHMDTVHTALPIIIDFNKKKGTVSSPNGIGGDDRCGIYMILEVVKKYNCSVLFCEDEEIGCVGAKKFVKFVDSVLSDIEAGKENENAKTLDSLNFNYIIEFDRRGSKDAVFYNCDNKDFEKFITEEYFKKAYGSFSDISIIAPALGCAAVNLSCGYYNAHMTSEYVVLSEMGNVISEACKILARTTEEDKFEYIEKPYSYSGSYRGNYSGSNYNYGGGYGASASWYDNEDDGGFYYLIEYTDEFGRISWWECYAWSKEEAMGKFLMEHENLCYRDVIDYYVNDGGWT